MLAALNPDHRALIDRAVAAEHAYWSLLKSVSDNDGLRRAMMEYYGLAMRVARHEYIPPPAPLWLSLEQATDIECDRERPRIRTTLALERARKRTGSGCGLVQLALGRAPTARHQLRRVIHASGLSIREVALAIGVAGRTIDRHLAGERMAAERLDWYARLEQIEMRGNAVHVISRLHPTPKRWGFGRSRRERQRLILDG